MSKNIYNINSIDKSIVVIGPTSSGKSDFAIALAKDYDGEVISADSRQIYRGMDIGSGKESGKITFSKSRGKITAEAYLSGSIPHYMIDIVSPNTDYNVAKFTKKAKQIQNDIIARNKIPIICGGTGFWAQSLIEDRNFPHVAPDSLLRSMLRNKTTEKLFHDLQKSDPTRACTIDPHNRVHLIRAIEIATKLGTVPIIEPVNYQQISDHYLIIAIDHPKEKLHKRIEKRLHKRIDAGMLDEVAVLHKKHRVSWTRLESFGLEYKWCALYLQGKVSREEMEESLLCESRQYAKRQMTWLRRWKRMGAQIHWITTLREARKLTRNFLR